MTEASLPLVSFVVLTYNQASYVQKAVEAALAQTYPHMEIIISDDASSDGTQSIITEITQNYRGPHNVKLNFNAKNLGVGSHVSRAFHMADGELILLAAGDDISLPERADKIVKFWLDMDKHPSAIFCSANTIDRKGELIGRFDPYISNGIRKTIDLIRHDSSTTPLLVLGACSAYTPDVICIFGDLPAPLQVEDVPLAIRASLLGGVEFLDEVLVNYRIDVSVWLAHKQPGEKFDRHYKRMIQRTLANYYVSRQILVDVRKLGNRDQRRIAIRRYIKDRFGKECYVRKSFSIKGYLRATRMGGKWMEALYPNVLYGTPRLHQMLFFLKNFLAKN